MQKVLVLATIAIWLAVLAVPDSKLHVIFCNVGQGDAVLLIYRTTQVLIDAGPDSKILSCLAKHLPFYDRQIELAVLTHPQADHMNGFKYVAERYTVKYFVSGVESDLMQKLDGKRVKAGDMIKINKLVFDIIWPTEKILGTNSEGTVNEAGVVSKLSFGKFTTLLTADVGSGAPGSEALVLKVPHHGSKFQMNQEWIDEVKPQLAVISVGKNSFGHPNQEALNLLSSNHIPVLRTDQDGEVEVVSDGVKWWVK